MESDRNVVHIRCPLVFNHGLLQISPFTEPATCEDTAGRPHSTIICVGEILVFDGEVESNHYSISYYHILASYIRDMFKMLKTMVNLMFDAYPPSMNRENPPLSSMIATFDDQRGNPLISPLQLIAMTDFRSQLSTIILLLMVVYHYYYPMRISHEILICWW